MSRSQTHGQIMKQPAPHTVHRLHQLVLCFFVFLWYLFALLLHLFILVLLLPAAVLRLFELTVYGPFVFLFTYFASLCCAVGLFVIFF